MTLRARRWVTEMSTDTALQRAVPDREAAKETLEATAWYVFVGGVGGAVGINIYASRLHPKVCDPQGALVLDACSRAVIGTANQYTQTAMTVAAVGFFVGAGFLLYDIVGGEADA